MRRIFSVMILLMLVSGLSWGASVPAFKQFTLYGNKGINQGVFQGKVSLLHVFARWCPTCQREHPFYVRLSQNNRSKLNFIGLSYKDNRRATQQWLRKTGNPYHRVIHDPNGNLAGRLGVRGTPTTYLVDQDGNIRFSHIGPLNNTIWQRDFAPRIKRLRSGFELAHANDQRLN